ncbi:hypothetical protein [Ensifer aridi]|uniref:hypothetical protein n=1 Tax=Ensifer aridi TaxID=1708715 RepID=UPI000A11B2CB|nr:hypothetical protein [Ensifer aridi]
MQIGMIEGHTRVCGKSQGFLGLPLRDELLNVEGIGPVNQMVSAWLPTPQELEALNAGAAVHVKIWGNVPAPMLVEVGEIPA